MAAAYDALAAFLAQRVAASGAAAGGLEPAAAGVARQTARSMAWYIRQQSAPDTREYVERRDEGMAENLAFLLDELYAGRKVIVWGHNLADPPRAVRCHPADPRGDAGDAVLGAGCERREHPGLPVASASTPHPSARSTSDRSTTSARKHSSAIARAAAACRA